MANPRPDRDSDMGGRLDRESTGTPRWLMVLGIVIALAVIALLVVLHLTGLLGADVHR